MQFCWNIKAQHLDQCALFCFRVRKQISGSHTESMSGLEKKDKCSWGEGKEGNTASHSFTPDTVHLNKQKPQRREAVCIRGSSVVGDCKQISDQALSAEVTKGGKWGVWFGSLAAGWLTNVEVALSLPAVLEVMDKWVANLTLQATVKGF